MRISLPLSAALLGLAALAVGTTPTTTPVSPRGKELALATFAGGCFWCVEEVFEGIPGVRSVESGYTGGEIASPTYEQVAQGTTGHYEAVQVRFEPERVSYEKLLEVFWRNIDPTDPRGQFCDKGPQYRSAVFWHEDAQRLAAERSKQALAASDRLAAPIATAIRPATTFYRAEEYHQDYARKNPIRYHFYRRSCGRDARLDEIWGTE